MREVYNPNPRHVDVGSVGALAQLALGEPVSLSVPRSTNFHAHGRLFVAHEMSITEVGGLTLETPVRLRFLTELDFRALKAASEIPLQRSATMLYDRTEAKGLAAIPTSRALTDQQGFTLPRTAALQMAGFFAAEISQTLPGRPTDAVLNSILTAFTRHGSKDFSADEKAFALRCLRTAQDIPVVDEDAAGGSVGNPYEALAVPSVENAFALWESQRRSGTRVIQDAEDARKAPNADYIRWLSRNPRIKDEFRNVEPPQTRDAQTELYRDLFLGGEDRVGELRALMMAAAPIRVPGRAQFYNPPRLMRSGYLEATLHWFAETIADQNWSIWYKVRFHTNVSATESHPPSTVVTRDIGPDRRQFLIRPTAEIRQAFSYSQTDPSFHMDASGNLWVDAARWEQARKPDLLGTRRTNLDRVILWAGHWPYVPQKSG